MSLDKRYDIKTDLAVKNSGVTVNGVSATQKQIIGTTFLPGPPGKDGVGIKGDTGPGLPAGGQPGQIVYKVGTDNYDTVWGDAPASYVPDDNRYLYERGTALSGLEFSPTVLPGVEVTDYSAATGQDFAYFSKKGFTFIRLPFLWERLQPTLNGDFDAAYQGYIDNAVDLAEQNGIRLILEPHNYGRRYVGSAEEVIGSANLPISAFANLWSRLAAAYKNTAAVFMYDLMNEPHDMPVPLSPLTYNPDKSVVQLITNPSFETDTTGWTLESGFTRSNTKADTGTWSVKQVSTTGYSALYSQAIPVKPNTDYVLTFRHQTQADFDYNTPNVQINWGDDAFGNNGGQLAQAQTTDISGNFTSFSLAFNSGTHTEVYVRIFNNNAAVTAYYDSFNVQPASQTIGYTSQVNGHDTATVTAMNQAAIDVIRAIDNKKWIALESDRYNGMQSFTAMYGSNPVKWWVDPNKRTMLSWHYYQDLDHSGTYQTAWSQPLRDRLASEVTPALQWAQNNAIKTYVGEYGVPNANNTSGQQYRVDLDTFLDILDDYFAYGTQWAAGRGYTSVTTLQPTDNYTTDRAQMDVLLDHLSALPGNGDMLKQVYDMDDNGIVDDSEKLGGQLPEYYATDAALDAHTVRTDNPHSVTKAQVGLSNVDNTSDANKPVSTAQQTALNAKENTANKGAANGYAPLGSDSKVPTANLPNFTAPDATTTSKGIVLLGGDLGGTAGSPTTPTAVHKTGAESVAGVKTLTDTLNLSPSTAADRAISSNKTAAQTTNNALVRLKQSNSATTVPVVELATDAATGGGLLVSNTGTGSSVKVSQTANSTSQAIGLEVSVTNGGTGGAIGAQFNNTQIKGIAAPTAAQDAVNKAYVDALSGPTITEYKNKYIVGNTAADYILPNTPSGNRAMIQQAIDDATANASGGEVIIKGQIITIDAPLTLKSNLNLHFQSRNGTLKLADGANSGLLTTAKANLSNLYVHDLTLDGNWSNQTDNTTDGQATFRIAGSGASTLENILIENVTIKDTWHHAFFISGDNNSQNLKIVRNCKVMRHGMGVVGFGLYNDYAPGIIYFNNRVEQSGQPSGVGNFNDAIELGHLGGTAIGNSIDGGQLQFPFGDNSIIANNILHTNTIQNDGNTANNVIIIGNRVKNATPISGFGGISLTGADGVIANNWVKSTAFHGIRTYGDGMTVMGNNVDGTNKDMGAVNGIYADHTSYGIITGNRIKNANKAIAIVYDYNVVTGNTVQNCNVGVDCSPFSGSAHTMIGNQVFGNELNGAITAVSLNGQTTALGTVQGVVTKFGDTMTGPLVMSSNKITSLANGTTATDAATFGQIPIAGTTSGTYAAGNDSRITGAEQTANKGAANGYAPLDSTGKVPAINLPAYVDDVKEYANLAAFPSTGVSDIIYIAIDTGKIYRWSGSNYIEISPSPGSTDTVPEGTTNLYYTNARVAAAPAVTGKKSAMTQQATQTASFTAVASNFYPVNASTGNVTVTLPTSTIGQEVQVKKLDANAAIGATSGIVNVTGTINGTVNATIPLRKQGMGKQYLADGSGGWTIVLGDLDITQLGASTTEQGFVQLAGDLTGTSNAPLLASIVTAGTVGNATAIPVITYDAKGRISATPTTVAPSDATRVLKAGDTMTGALTTSGYFSATGDPIGAQTSMPAGSYLGLSGTTGKMLFVGTSGALIDFNNTSTNPQAGYAGRIIYLHSSNMMTFGTGNSSRMNVSNTGLRVGDGTAATSTLQSVGSFATATRTITAARTLDATDYTILANGTFTVTLPTAVGIQGRMYVVKNIGTGTITVATTSSQTIDGATTRTITAQYGFLVLQSDNANWYIVG